MNNDSIKVIHWKNFKNYADRWFADNLEKKKVIIDKCLNEVQRRKQEGAANPLVELVPVLGIIDYYPAYNPDENSYFENYEEWDLCEYAFIKETNKYEDVVGLTDDEDVRTRVVYDDYHLWKKHYSFVKNYHMKKNRLHITRYGI